MKNIIIFLFLGTFIIGCQHNTTPSPTSNSTSSNDDNIFTGSTQETIKLPVASGSLGYNGVDNTGFGLKVSDGFEISIFADDLEGARDLVGPDAQGNYYLSRTKPGAITLIEVSDQQVINSYDIIKNLNNPHGLLIDYENNSTLYYAESDKISKILLYSDAPVEKIIDLPSGGRHFTRSLAWGEDGKIYISIGSTCDVCYEKDEMIATIYSMNKDGSELTQVAKGLRNAVFMDINPVSGELWVTEMGRDRLGDDLPPDEINIIKSGNDYGWPICYGKNIHDTQFDTNTYIQNPCEDKISSHIDLQAHSAPLGLQFIPEEGWPEGYGLDLFVAYHGSWNRSEPTGYKIMHIMLDDDGNEVSRRDFISGWKQGDTTLGRPVDILSFPGGISYITDDYAGKIYKVNRISNQ